MATTLLIQIFKVAIALSLCFIAITLRTPFLASLRNEFFWVILVLGLGLIAFEVFNFKQKSLKSKPIISFLVVALCCSSLAIAITQQIQFNLTKRHVLSQNAAQLEKLGQHFIVGYRDLAEVKTLVEKRAIAGVFITRRNINNKTFKEIQEEISSLQNIRASQGLPPLWVASDQEGGIVSRLSPPLTQLPPLSKIVEEEISDEQKKSEVIQYAFKQGKELSALGINLNFAPVVDLNKGVVNPQDKYSQIYRRAISADKEVVASVALWYCNALGQTGVRCTIKHFPGLGRVEDDTHLASADLQTSIAELAKDDWVPFREMMKSQAFTMLGHAKLTALDTVNPVSFSHQVVTELIRNDWQHDGVLITDDFSMQAVYGSKAGLKAATVQAINVGVDLILIAYDKDLYYPAMSALLKAEESGKLDSALLERSRVRLEQNQKLLKSGT
ncbi:MAG: glycoside hydrolase family 3 protein [Kastovskya adunca ATA6-11-RM4]|jgi:beta-N-acetylhexosaminidase|nr:glycoside hydrolase family 3 protein [Kastovskya adunca ATA6-11-RM4]